MSDFEKIESQLKKVLALLSNDLIKENLAVQLSDIYILVNAGEYEVALEQLTSHILEAKILLPIEADSLIKQTGELMDMDPDIWERLQATDVAA